MIPLASSGVFARPLATEFFARPASIGDRVLVLINLAGGNDGLNTIVPFNDPAYDKARPNLRLDKSQLYKVTVDLGLHPSMQGIYDLYRNGRCAIVENVGYPNQDRSHFRSTDIWHTSSDAETVLFTGWIGRYLEKIHPEYPSTLPSAPFAIQISSATTLLLQGEQGNTGIAIDNPDRFYNLAKGLSPGGDPPPATLAGPELSYVREILEQSNAFSSTIHQAMLDSTTQAEYDADSFSSQLKVVARLINGGLPTSVYVVSLSGFDTHSGQLNAQAQLLNRLSRAVSSFLADVGAAGNDDRVVCMTYSEFGRRVNENGSAGTDHGAAAPVIVFGKPVLGNQVIGGVPNLTDLDDRGDIKYTVDFRQIYTTLLQDWMGLGATDSQEALGGDFAKVPLFAASSVHYGDGSVMAGMTLDQNQPNPATSITTLSFSLPIAGTARLSLYDMTGREVKTFFNRTVESGTHSVRMDVSDLPAGAYVYRLQFGRFGLSKTMRVVR
jgi:uncharacterized protein (DUF1501 family)